MFFMLPLLIVLAVYILAAVLPAVFLLRYVYRLDRIEKEPPMLLLSLLLMGVFSALCSILLEWIGQSVLSAFVDTSSPAYVILLAFLVVAAAEEGTKLLFLRRKTWNDANFNYRFDGIIYAVFVSLGFAAFENIRYIMGYGLTAAIPRAILAIPGHMGFAVFMGVFYGRAKLCQRQGNKRGETVNLLLGYLSAVFLHGFYDACAMIGNVLSTLVFILFVIVMYIVVIRMLKRESLSDGPLY